MGSRKNQKAKNVFVYLQNTCSVTVKTRVLQEGSDLRICWHELAI